MYSDEFDTKLDRERKFPLPVFQSFLKKDSFSLKKARSWTRLLTGEPQFLSEKAHRILWHQRSRSAFVLSSAGA
jgi:hypothetical protein